MVILGHDGYCNQEIIECITDKYNNIFDYHVGLN